MKKSFDEFEFESSAGHLYMVEFNGDVYLHTESDLPSFTLSNEPNNRPVNFPLSLVIRRYQVSDIPNTADYIILNPLTANPKKDSEPMDIKVKREQISSLELII